MRGYHGNIEQQTVENTSFRHVLYTAKHTQLVLMCLRPGEEIGMEVHNENDQFFRFEAGRGRAVIDDNEYEVGEGSAIIVPSGATHNVINTSDSESLKFYTLYSPPHHKDGIVRSSKAEASTNAPEFDGTTTEQ
jgi:mannose-6-phosphate isomerase-like protein (cupin superfamily)